MGLTEVVQVVVRGCEEAMLRIERTRQLVRCHEALPVVLRIQPGIGTSPFHPFRRTGMHPDI